MNNTDQPENETPSNPEAAEQNSASTTPETETSPPTSENEVNQWAMFLHLSGILLSALGPLIIWLIQKEKMPQLESHYKKAMNFQIPIAIGLIASVILMSVFIGLLTYPIIALGNLIICIMVGLKVNNGEEYKYPFSFPFIK